jgi:hypothetical protein
MTDKRNRRNLVHLLRLPRPAMALEQHLAAGNESGRLAHASAQKVRELLDGLG